MVPAIKDKAGSTTKSAVSAAQITVTDKEKADTGYIHIKP